MNVNDLFNQEQNKLLSLWMSHWIIQPIRSKTNGLVFQRFLLWLHL